MTKQIPKVSRLESLTDGIFAIAMTILVLELQIPKISASMDLWQILNNSGVLHNLFIYAGSFIILGTQWVAISFQHGYLEHVNRPFLWVNIFYLMMVCIVPFSASLAVDYAASTASISFFAINLLVISIGQLFISLASGFYQLNNDAYTKQIHSAIMQRILISPMFCFFSLIAAHWNTYIAFILLTIPPLIYLVPGRVDKFSRES